jgi:Icc-related predicted phosphoesterase
LLAQGERRLVGGLRVAAIGGIWAKSHAKPFYVTDADVAECATRIAASGPLDVQLTHGCPVGLADLTPTGRHGGQRCFLDASKLIAPRLHLCGHLHVAQERTMKDGRQVINVGATPEGAIVVIDFDPATGELHARPERLAPS